MTTTLFGAKDIISISYDQEEILRDIITLHAPAGIELDATYGAGAFYKNMKGPVHKFDIKPRAAGVVKADSKALPLADSSVDTAMFDPPFVLTDHKDSDEYLMHYRFSSFKTIVQLREMYRCSLQEHHRVLKAGGILIVKCQDMAHGHMNYFIHHEVMQMCGEIGFIPVDLFILLAKNRFMGRVHKQRIARKFHSYFLVFKKRKRAKKKAVNKGALEALKAFTSSFKQHIA